MSKVRYISNGSVVGDGMRVARVSQDGAVFEFLTDPRTERFSPVEYVPDPTPEPIPPEMWEMEIDMTGYTETSGKRLIPVSAGHEIHDMVVAGQGTVTPDWTATGFVEFNTPPFAISVGRYGDVLVSQPNGTEGNNPGNNVTGTILTISSYRTKVVVKGVDVISNPKTGVAITIKGQTVTGDTIAPTIVAINPSGPGISVSTPITLTFSESVQRGTGNVVLWNETLNSQIEAFDMATAPTSGAGSVATNLAQMTFTPSANLPPGTQVSIRPAAGSVKDLANNGIAAVTGSLWSFTTQVATTPPSSMSPDVTVSSVNSILATLDAWIANPSGTAPSGKAPLDDRIIGVNANLPAFTITNRDMPMKVFIRPVGTFGITQINGWNEPACSVVFDGVVELSGCTNITLWRCDIRAPSTAIFTNGIARLTNCTNCFFEKCVFRGWPHQLVQGTYGTTQRGVKITGGTNVGCIDPISLYTYDANIIASGTISGLTLRGLGGRHSGGNGVTLATGSVISDLLIEDPFFDRVYHPYKSLHGDNVQYNAGAVTHRYIARRWVSYRGHWTGSYNPNTNGQLSDVVQNLFSAQGGSGSTGPNKMEHCFVATGQSRGIDKVPGGAVLTTDFNTMLDGVYPVGQRGQSPFPRIIATDVSNRNFITAQNAAMGVNEGTGGVRLIVSANHSEILPYYGAVPTDLTDLYDVLPVAGAITHPSYSNPNARVGCFDLWGKLFLGDSTVVASKRGWPVAVVWKEDFDPQNRFLSNYTGNFDANGDNA